MWVSFFLHRITENFVENLSGVARSLVLAGHLLYASPLASCSQHASGTNMVLWPGTYLTRPSLCYATGKPISTVSPSRPTKPTITAISSKTRSQATDNGLFVVQLQTTPHLGNFCESTNKKLGFRPAPNRHKRARMDKLSPCWEHYQLLLCQLSTPWAIHWVCHLIYRSPWTFFHINILHFMS